MFPDSLFCLTNIVAESIFIHITFWFSCIIYIRSISRSTTDDLAINYKGYEHFAEHYDYRCRPNLHGHKEFEFRPISVSVPELFCSFYSYKCIKYYHANLIVIWWLFHFCFHVYFLVINEGEHFHICFILNFYFLMNSTLMLYPVYLSSNLVQKLLQRNLYEIAGFLNYPLFKPNVQKYSYLVTVWWLLPMWCFKYLLMLNGLFPSTHYIEIWRKTWWLFPFVSWPVLLLMIIKMILGQFVVELCLMYFSASALYLKMLLTCKIQLNLDIIW